ncbi:hypothetical protein N7509_005752 [Penicillium cosmopolitanum]|uniref:Uncharacterized protein n=1 Tax=Penicillium cosmopolitanum TaxID=1131564 RepID=A0A9X0BAD8_9EURO|nr:uncharacterized protein N7509_005752 [Penicillium cosmopolitanum]KAJ5397639.1 hypothetical protein N7509_005752 [Penicillium cosmopolitanum]
MNAGSSFEGKVELLVAVADSHVWTVWESLQVCITSVGLQAPWRAARWQGLFTATTDPKYAQLVDADGRKSFKALISN